MQKIKRFLIGLITILGLCTFIGLFAIGEYDKKQKALQQVTQQVYAVGVKNFAGYPAPESQLVPGQFYYCNASIVEIRPARTNYFSVLQTMVPEPNGTWRATSTNRFFELPQRLDGGTIYIIGKGESNLIYKPVAAPGTTQMSNSPQA